MKISDPSEFELDDLISETPKVVISNKIPLFDTEENVIGLLGISRVLPKCT
ncbi:MAG TPA: hypothetical protein VNK03_02930 [Gammaproteobacteria bacterium]|nr:hypothetical protein [Gammaproteobacteria bacterium]